MRSLRSHKGRLGLGLSEFTSSVGSSSSRRKNLRAPRPEFPCSVRQPDLADDPLLTRGVSGSGANRRSASARRARFIRARARQLLDSSDRGVRRLQALAVGVAAQFSRASAVFRCGSLGLPHSNSDVGASIPSRRVREMSKRTRPPRLVHVGGAARSPPCALRSALTRAGGHSRARLPDRVCSSRRSRKPGASARLRQHGKISRTVFRRVRQAALSRLGRCRIDMLPAPRSGTPCVDRRVRAARTPCRQARLAPLSDCGRMQRRPMCTSRGRAQNSFVRRSRSAGRRVTARG